jgi:D-alanyl-D-alanine carboxypeptidase
MADLQTHLTEMMRRLIGGPIRSAVVALDWRGHGSVAAAAGTARHDTGAPMRVETQWHIASVAKPMTAVLIFQAAEEGLLGRDGIDARLIDTGALSPDICRRLARKDGVSYGETITLRQLLTHTAGLRDAQIDDGDTTSEGYGSKPAPNSIVGSRAADYRRHIDALTAGRTPDPGLRTMKRWLPWDPQRPDDREAGLVNYYLNVCGHRALWPPGQAFHYSDTAFTILALVAEKLLGASYHRLLRARIFDPLGMNDSFLEAHSDLDPAPWVREVSDCWAGDVPLVSYGVTLSNDWGGGGVVATTGDLNRFMQGLMQGKLFRRAETLAEMLRWQEPPGRPSRYEAVGCGIFTYRTPAGHALVGHSGAWGGRMLSTPDGALTLSGTVNMRAAQPAWIDEIADEVLRTA